ncbi:hypothetical protein N0V88_000735 [Collariella sp. IMI 366227]|nr:hypothetical protein N0V88_000735 [Collariella sp. IMI 366227]
MNPADGSANGASTSTEKNASSSTPLHQPSQLQSKEHRDLLDVIDRLRKQGLSRYVDLPQIIVCGDQSSGKSSALEAISSMSFPAKDNLCTRFATELILRRAPVAGIDISISPGSDRTEDEQATLEAFTYTGTLETLDLGRIIDDAKNAMGLNEASKVFSTDVLRVEVSGPSQPHLTLVDLPGLFLAGNKDQSEQDAALVEKLVLSYMKNPRTIILAVVSAKSDFALQQVTRHTREQDPRGKRTLGLITKPDTLDQGSDSERFYIQLAQNRDVHFGLGWHVLRNRTYAERNDSAAARDAAEADFFSNGVWTSLKPSQLGVASLRLRLSYVLRNQILSQLPSVLEDVTEGIDECRATLQQLGTPRVTLAEQRRHLLKVSARWSEMARAAIDGMYTDSFFHEAADRRLRAVAQKTLAAFAKDMHLKGHAKNIIDYSDDEDSDDDTPGPHVIRRSTYINKVKMLMVDSRGRELPGTYNPLIVGELFRKQCKPWHGMVRSVLESTFHAASHTMESILQHAADEETATALLSIVVVPAMEVIRAGLWSEADKILEPHISGHPITYNHYLTDNVQKAQAQRLRLKLEEHLKLFFNTSELSSGLMNYKFDMLKLFDKLTVRMEPDMDTYSCSMAIDMMEAYYKVALKTVIDSVSTLAVERCLLQKLPGILNPEVVCELPDDIVSRIAAEGPESVAKREQATEKLAVLEEAMVELRRLGTLGGQGTEGVTAV